VPPGFVLTTETCLAFFASGKMLPPGLKQEYLEALCKARRLHSITA
jgi:phosphoenolpyruvate synthase/pyruvate phosphate dikinase